MTAVRNLLLKSFGISAAAAALAVFSYGAQVQAQAAKGRDDCVWTPEGVDAKTKKKTKAACKAKPKDKKADPKKK